MPSPLYCTISSPQFSMWEPRLASHYTAGNEERTLVVVEKAVRHEDVTVRIEAEGVAEGLHGNDGTGDGFILRDHRLDENLQGVPC